MFRTSFGGKHSNEWNFKFAAEAATVETKMLSDDITIAELARSCKVATVTMKKFLLYGIHNKAWKALKDRHWL